MKLNEQMLRDIIREEYLRITPVAPGEPMSEARALYLAEEVLQEGIFSNLFAGVKGAAGKAGEKTAAAGTAVGKAVSSKAKDVGTAVASAAKSIAAPIQAAGKTAADAIRDIKDAGVKAAAANAADEIKATLGPVVKKQVAILIQKSRVAGRDETEAQAEAQKIVQDALVAAIAST